MARYKIVFQKEGLIKYTSHLDLLRIFKRGFKSSGLPLDYSNGFNPHPKMGFAQPLSLGYEGMEELLEFNTTEPINCSIFSAQLKEQLPEGINILSLEEIPADGKTLASMVKGAKYKILLPLSYKLRHDDIEKSISEYLNQPEIIAKKREKKSKKYVDKDIKNQIRDITIINDNEFISMILDLDCGSDSNLNPELVINSFAEFAGLAITKADVEVERISLELS